MAWHKLENHVLEKNPLVSKDDAANSANGALVIDLFSTSATRRQLLKAFYTGIVQTKIHAITDSNLQVPLDRFKAL